MDYRVLLLIPEGLTFDQLSIDQQTAINNVLGQYVMPMPGTVAADGLVICDAVTAGNFDPASMAGFGFDWPIIGLWMESGEPVIFLDQDELMSRLPDVVEYDENGNELSRTVPMLHEPHRWGGWPALF